jgi:hypothetical protein
MAPQASHESLHRALVERMAAELRPVRRLWPVPARLALWIALEGAVLLLLILHSARTDLAEQLRNPWFVLCISGFAVTGAASAALALRAAIPGREPAGKQLTLVVCLAIASAVPLLLVPVDARQPLGSFVARGLPCLIGIAMSALVPWLALLWAVRRAAPMRGGLEGALIGAAAFLFSFALLRIRCPIEEEMHLLVWHLLPALAGIGLSAWLGVALLKRPLRR